MKQDEIIVQPNHNQDFLQLLQVSPFRRTEEDVDNMVSQLSTWPEFSKYLPSLELKKEICRRISYEEHEAKTILFTVGEDSDSWYLVYKGKCEMFVEWEDDSFNSLIPDSFLAVLRREFGQNANFKFLETKQIRMKFVVSVFEKIKNDRFQSLFPNQPNYFELMYFFSES